MTLQLGILASGSGSNAQAIVDAVQRGVLDARIRSVFCNRPGAKVLERARNWGCAVHCLDHKGMDRAAFDARMVELLRGDGVDTVAMAGYMRLVTPVFLSAFPGRALNIHPALLPSFKGAHGAADALAWGVKLSGCSVHFVSEDMDCGPLIIQAAVPVHTDDTVESLQARILGCEHRIYPQALQWLAEGRLGLGKGCRTVELASAAKAGARPVADALIWPPLEEGF